MELNPFEERVAKLVSHAAIYIQNKKDDDAYEYESMRIVCAMDDEGYFLAEGEESGESYHIYYSEVDLDMDDFYQLKLMDNRGNYESSSVS
jgi:hypothetical protein